jgi:hypothetical protein
MDQLLGFPVLPRHDHTDHVPGDLDWLGVVEANTKLHGLGGLEDLDLIDEGPHGSLEEVQVVHHEAQLCQLLPMLIQGELGNVHEDAKLPVLKCSSVCVCVWYVLKDTGVVDKAK